MSTVDRARRVRSLAKSFACAWRGIVFCVKNERHMRIHLTVGAYVLVFAQFYRFSAITYALLLLTIAIVIAAEAFNTAIEAIVNLETQSYDNLARIAKDVAAGAVLICAVFAAAVGIILFLKPATILYILNYLATHWLWCGLFLISLPAAAAFIFFFPLRKREK